MNRLFVLAALAFGLTACVAIPKAPLTGGKHIPIGPGTEDIVLDPNGGHPRLLISCDDRRDFEPPKFGMICSLDLQTQKVDTLKVIEYPRNLSFRPHGLDYQEIGGRKHLFAVCHDDTAGHHWVADFQIDGELLVWIQNFSSDLLTSPNAVCALPDGNLYVTNDHHVRGSMKESLFKQKVADIIHFRPDVSNHVAFTGLAYGNGITQKDGKLYVAATVENAVYKFSINADGTLSGQTKVAKVKGPDNLRWDGNDLIVACHLRLLKFIGHANNAKKHSPTVIYRIQPGSLKPVPVYADRGKTISAGSTGLIWNDRLFIGQVFENWIIEVGK